MNSSKLAPMFYELLQEAATLRLDDLGIAPAGDARTFDLFADCVRKGRCAEMTYLVDNIDARRSPRSILPNVQSLIVVALSEKRLRDESREATATLLNAPELQTSDDGASVRQGAVSGYATCLDYHDVLRKRLRELARFIVARFPDASTRAVVDSAPLLEKSWAVDAGLGFCGLHSLTIHPRLGSRFFLGELLTSVPFEALAGVKTAEEYLVERNKFRRLSGEDRFDASQAMKGCLSCRRCVDACPTNALMGDRTLDARRCLNYWTIENRDAIPNEIALRLGGRLFGCDLCQRVCPHNSGVESATPQDLPLDAVERLDEETFRRLFKKTPIFRARVEGLKRVAASLRRFDGDDKK